MDEEPSMNTTFQVDQVDEQLLVQFTEMLEPYRDKPGSLIPALQAAQNVFGYIPKPAMNLISQTLDEPLSRVLGVVTFYSFFSTVPRGKYVIRVCLGTACYVRGGKEVVESLQTALEVDVGQTTADRLFTLEVARCFGACGLAPILMVNDDVHPHVKPVEIDNLLAQYRNGGNDNGKGGNA
jgi:NADH:ubiquinone oxidoreductase subunit E